MRLKLIVGLFALLTVIGGLWAADHYWQVNKAQSAKIEALEASKKRAEDDLAAERAWSADREAVIAKLLIIRTEMNEMRTALEKNDRAHAKALQELKENDQEVREYLTAPVPAALGMQFKRTATTDPTKYRASREVPVDAMPAAKP